MIALSCGCCESGKKSARIEDDGFSGSAFSSITQPQYHGIPAEPRDIERGFLAAGWTRLKDPSGHVIFFNHAFRVMAIDAERRNCYLTDGQLQPFDVILCTPDEKMERYLGIYPEG